MGSLKAFIAFVLISAAAPLAVQAADFDGSKPLLCAVISITECTPNDGCQKTMVAIPSAIKVFNWTATLARRDQNAAVSQGRRAE